MPRVIKLIAIISACLALVLAPAVLGAEVPQSPSVAHDTIETWEDAVFQLNPSDDPAFQQQPPEEGPPSSTMYFRWSGTIQAIQEPEQTWARSAGGPFRGGSGIIRGHEVSVYMIWDAQGAFAFRDIKKVFTGGELHVGRQVEVIGRYTNNIYLQMTNGYERVLPLLTTVYIR